MTMCVHAWPFLFFSLRLKINRIDSERELFILEKGAVANSLFLNFCPTTGGTEVGQGQLPSCTQVILWQPREQVPQPEETYCTRDQIPQLYIQYIHIYIKKVNLSCQTLPGTTQGRKNKGKAHVDSVKEKTRTQCEEGNTRAITNPGAGGGDIPRSPVYSV